jgi:hypothetical protein
MKNKAITRLVKADVDIEKAFLDVRKSSSDYEGAIAEVNKFIEDIVTAYDEDLIDDSDAMELLSQFKSNPKIDIFSEINSWEDYEEVAASIKDVAKKLKPKFLEEKITDRLEIIVPSMYRRKVTINGVEQYYQLTFNDITKNKEVLKLLDKQKEVEEIKNELATLHKEREEMIEDIEKLFSEWCGGFSYINDTAGGGGWKDDETNELVIEPNTKIYTDCTKRQASKWKNTLKGVAESRAKSLHQDSVYIRVHNATQYIEQYSC